MTSKKKNRPDPPPLTLIPPGVREAAERRKYVGSANLYADEVRWAREVAAHRDVSIAELLSPLIRQWLWEERYAILTEKAKAAEEGRDTPL